MLGVAVAVLATLSARPDSAQAQQPTISVAAKLTAEPGVRSPLAIRVGPAASLPRNSFLRIRGLPPMAALSDGHSIAPGSWAVPLTALANLSVLLAPDAPANSEIVVTLVAVDGAVLAEARSTLVLASAARPPNRATQAEPDSKAPTSATILRSGAEPPAEQRGVIGGPGLRTGQSPGQSMTPEDRERATRLLQKGEDHLSEGNVSAARLMFEKAADAGLAQAAMALAATFDAAELSRLSVRGIQADAKEARRWYERALQLGSREAEQRLRRLGAN
jgi:hypothetical protein